MSQTDKHVFSHAPRVKRQSRKNDATLPRRYGSRSKALNGGVGVIKATPRRESAIQAEILRLLRAHGVTAYPLNRERAGYRRASHIGVKGLPDIGGWIRQPYDMAAPLYIEVKCPGGKLRPEQAAFIRRAAADGCHAFMATSPADVAAHFGWPFA